MSESLYAAPCVFCRYNGPNYYQAESHERHCPWWEVGGLDERAKLFRSKLVAKLEAAEAAVKALRGYQREATSYHTLCGHGQAGCAAECDSICEQMTAGAEALGAWASACATEEK